MHFVNHALNTTDFPFALVILCKVVAEGGGMTLMYKLMLHFKHFKLFPLTAR